MAGGRTLRRDVRPADPQQPIRCGTAVQRAGKHAAQLVDENGKKTSARVRNLTPTDLANIVGTLTNEQVKMAKAMSSYLSAKNGPAGWGNETSQKLYGLDKYTEKQYWPIKTDGNQTRTSDANVGGNAGLWAVKNQGFTKNLAKFANNSILLGDAFDTWCNHVANMATYSEQLRAVQMDPNDRRTRRNG